MSKSYMAQKINGLLILNKPSGISSNHALQRAKRLFRAEKAGHTGVLDPLATGVLPLCFGEATKFAQYLLDANKAYRATLKFGQTRNTGDSDGEIVEQNDIRCTKETFIAACQQFTGSQSQVPPMFSALKYQGRALYEYAREGVTIERKARDIHIYSIDCIDFSTESATIDVVCSKGTYIRTLAEDISRHAGVLAHLIALERTASAGFALNESYTLPALENMNDEEKAACLLPCDIILHHFQVLTLPAPLIEHLICGCAAPFVFSATPKNIAAPFRIYSADNRFIGLATYNENRGTLQALRLMNTSSCLM